MNIMCIIERGVYYKFCSPVIEQALKQGHKVYTLHNYSEPYPSFKVPKSLSFPFLNQIPQFTHGTVIAKAYRSNTELLNFIKEKKIDTVIAIAPKSHYWQSDINVNWYVLQAGQDIFQDQFLFTNEKIFVYSNNWVTDDWKKKNPDVKTIEVGAYHYYTSDTFNTDKIREKYSLPDKKIFLYLPLDGYGLLPISNYIKRIYLRYIYACEKKILSHIKKFCDDNGYHIVLKSRLKKMLDESYEKFGTVVYDETFYPATIEEMVSISDIVLSDFYYSTTIAEAIFYRKKYITVTYDYLEYDMTPNHRNYRPDGSWREIFLPAKLHHSIPSDKFNAAAIEKIAACDYDNAAADAYIKKYLSPSGNCGPASMIQYIENNS